MAVTVIKNYTRRVVATKKSNKALILTILLLGGAGIALALYLRKKNSTSENTDTADTADTSTTEENKPAADIKIKTKDANPVIVKDDKKPATKPNAPTTPPTFPLNTKLLPGFPLIKAVAYDKSFKNLGKFKTAVFKGDFNYKWLLGEVTVSSGLGFKIIPVYLLKKDWVKA